LDLRIADVGNDVKRYAANVEFLVVHGRRI
jgi:hypothetical protein